MEGLIFGILRYFDLYIHCISFEERNEFNLVVLTYFVIILLLLQLLWLWSLWLWLLLLRLSLKSHYQSNSLVIEHRSSPSVCHLTLNLAVTVVSCHISLLICCCVPPSVSGPPSLILLLLVPLKGCLSHMSIWSPQRVANPTPHSFFYLLSYQSPPCLPPQLFFSDRMEPPNVQDSP